MRRPIGKEFESEVEWPGCLSSGMMVPRLLRVEMFGQDVRGRRESRVERRECTPGFRPADSSWQGARLQREASLAEVHVQALALRGSDGAAGRVTIAASFGAPAKTTVGRAAVMQEDEFLCEAGVRSESAVLPNPLPESVVPSSTLMKTSRKEIHIVPSSASSFQLEEAALEGTNTERCNHRKGTLQHAFLL